MSDSQRSESRSVVNATRWAYVMTWGREGAAAVVALVLAGLLGPESFGLMAMAWILIQFLQLFVEQGVTSILIRDCDEPRILDTAFWLVLGTGTGIASITLAASPVWAAWMRTPELQPVLGWLALVLPLRALTVVQQAWLQRRLDFRTLALRSSASVLGSGAIGLALAFRGAGVWALVAQQLAAAALDVLLLWGLCPWRPAARFSFAEARSLIGSARHLLSNNLGVFAHRRSDSLFLAYFVGPAALALYRVAERVVELVIELTTRPVSQVALPAFAAVRGDRQALAATTRVQLARSAGASWPVLAGVAVSGSLIFDLLGPEWSAATPILRVFCILAAVRAVTLITGPLLIATSRTRPMSAMTWGLAACNLLGFAIVGHLVTDLGAERQAWAIVVSRVAIFSLLYFPVSLWWLARVGGLRPHVALRAVTPAFGTAVAVAVMTAGAGTVLERLDLSTWARLLGMALVGGTTALVLAARSGGLATWLPFPIRSRRANEVGP